MNKLIENDKVAVIISGDYGVGWFSDHGIRELLFDPNVVAMIQADERNQIPEYCRSHYGDYYFSGTSLRIVWVPVGAEFEVRDYDGLESIMFKTDVEWITA